MITANVRSRFDLRRCIPMTRAEEQACALEYVATRSPPLAERLIIANMRLVVKIVHTYRRANCDLSDLVQEGNLGLVHAVTRFDPRRGVKLASYAAWWIRAYILKFIMENWRLVKTGTTQAQRKLFFNLQKERSKLEADGIQPGNRQLASALQVREKDIAMMLERFAGAETSLDARLKANPAETRTLGDSLSDKPGVQPDVKFERSEFAEVLHGKLAVFADSLRGRDSTIFRRRLLSDEPATLSDLAADFGVTRERARQLEQRLKGRIRDYLTSELGNAVEPTSDLLVASPSFAWG